MIYRLFLIIYTLVIFMPSFRALDIIASQGLYLNIVNFCSSLYIFYKVFLKKYKPLESKSSTNNFIFYSLFFFLIWSTISSTWSINKSEAFRTLSEFFTVILAFINIYYHSNWIKGNKIHFIFMTLLAMQIIEVSALLYNFIPDLYNGNFKPGGSYTGLTGNKNIASFSILMKLPVLIYFISLKKHKIRILISSISFISLFFTTYIIFFVTLTRAAQLAFILLVIFYVFYLFYSFFLHSKELKAKKKLRQFSFLIPIIASFIVGNLFTNNRISVNQNISTAFETTDSSTNERIRFYNYAIEIIRDNFFTGTGIGSFELESIEKDRLEMRSYVVPYHTHNDFLEIFSETGFPGFIFLYAPILIFFVVLLISIFKKNKIKNPFLLVLIFLMLSMYIADALINFPIARVIQNINLIFCLTLCLHVFEKHNIVIFDFKKIRFNKLNIVLLIFLFLSPLSIYSSFRQFRSAVDQSLLLFAFNNNNFKIFKKEDLKNIERIYPDLTLTALPISTIIGLHYYSYKDYTNAAKYFKEGIKANPYMNVNQSYLGMVYQKQGVLDSAKYYTKYAFDKMPNNPVHFAHYVQVLLDKNDTLSIKKAYESVTKKERDQRFQKLYFLAMSNLLDRDEGRLVLNEIKKNQLNSDGLKASYYVLELGRKAVLLGHYNYKKAEFYFKENDFKNAAKFYDLAFENNPLEYPYIENAAISYLRLNQLDVALERINIVIENMDSDNINAKAFYIKGLIFLQKDDIQKACQEFEKALKNGLNTKIVLSSYCK